MSGLFSSTKDLPETLPLFDLSGALLLPRAQLPLHVFEPRYLAMLEHALGSGHRLIGMIQRDESGAPGALHKVGCAGRITGFAETDDHRYLITLTGICRFELTEAAREPGPWLQGHVNWQPFSADLAAPPADPGLDRERLLSLLDRFLSVTGLRTDPKPLQEAPDEMLVNALAMSLPFSAEDKQALLEAPDLPARRETLEALLAFGAHSPGEGNDGPTERMQ